MRTLTSYDSTGSTSSSYSGLELPEELKFKPVLRSIEHDGKVLSSLIGQKIVRDDKNEVLGIVKSRYAPQPYSALWNPLLEGLQNSDLDMSKAEVKWSIMNNGARMFADITLRQYDYDKIVGEPTALAMRVYNSVDGSLSYSVTAFIKRLVCLNGMTSVGQNTSVRFKHTAGTDPVRIAQVASTWPVALENDAHMFNHMKAIPIQRPDAQTFLTKNLCVTRTKSKIKTNEKWLNTMMSLYDRYSDSIGNNTYALYNALTHYGTHIDLESVRGADLGNRALRQEKDVKNLVQGRAFKNLINYDEFEQRLAA